MKEITEYDCKVHVNVCVNEKPAPKACCIKVGGMEFFQNLKAKVKETGLHTDVWVTKTGCLGFCNDVGTTVAIHRAGKKSLWYTEVTSADFEKIWTAIQP